MIAHLLLIKPGHDLDEDERRELESTIPRLAAIPGVRNLSWGRDFSGRGKGYEYGAIMYFDTSEALASYAGNASHREIISVFERLGVDRLVIDYETGTSASST